MPPVVFYVSGHGFGHAARTLEVINELGRLRPDMPIVVRTSVAPWFIEAGARVPIQLQTADTDTGVAQIDSLRLDEDETARRAAAFYLDFNDRVDREAALLDRLGAAVVVSDIPPLGLAAAARAGLPALAMGNFTWDWIYEGYPRFEQLAPGVLDTIVAAYARCTRALRLPLHGGFQPMTGRLHDLPFIARRSQLGREAARRALGFGARERVVLASFGGHGVRLPYARIVRHEPFTLAVTDHEVTDEPPAGLRRFTRTALAERGCQYEDLVAAADVVVTKPGYGIVSECVANGTALLYTDRGRFREHDVFVAEMPEILRCSFIAREDLLAGRWVRAIDALLRQPPPPAVPPIDGARHAAEVVLTYAGTLRG